MEDENPVIGHYKDGKPIHQHPSEQEIQEHIDEWYDLMCRIGNKEQMEIIEEMRNFQINTHFQRCTAKMTDEQVIQEAIKWWMEQYPWEVKPFEDDVKFMRQNLYNAKGYANDKAASMVLFGRIPDKIKTLCIAHRPDFWSYEGKKKSKNQALFYKLYPQARISSYKNL